MNSAEFMAVLEAFLTRTGMTPAALGESALGDPNFVRECRGGRSPRLDTVDVVMGYMRKYEAKSFARAHKKRPAA